MEKVFLIKKKMQKKIPAVTHIDGSGRLQTVEKNTNPKFYDLIKEFFKITKIPILINTSFNLNGEPIVCTPKDAIRTFNTSGLDLLVIGDFIVKKKMKKFNISGFWIGDPKMPFIIAEAGVNHNGSIALGKKMIDVASKAGAHAIKFQTFVTEEIILKKAPKASYHKRTTGSDKKLSWYDLLKSQEMSLNMHKKLIQHCKKRKIIFLSTPYDEKSSDLLEKLGVKAIKIASTDNNNIKLISHIAKKKIPIILSTGMMDMKTLEQSIKVIRKNGNSKIVILQCTSNYPCTFENTNLSTLKEIKKKFKTPVGFSDHTEGNLASIVATTLGACVIEKHFTLNKKFPGPDHIMSMNPRELEKFIFEIKNIYKLYGKKNKVILNCEIENFKKLKKSLVSKYFIKKGNKINLSMITAKRPGTGIQANKLNLVIGKKAKRNIQSNTIIKSEMLK